MRHFLSISVNDIVIFLARMLFTAFYFLFVGPVGLVLRLFDPLCLSSKAQSGWIPVRPQDDLVSSAHKQN
jgi:hypothetical protein